MNSTMCFTVIYTYL